MRGLIEVKKDHDDVQCVMIKSWERATDAKKEF